MSQALESDMDDDSSPPKPAPAPDVLLLHSPTEDQKGIRVLRARNQQIEVGEIRAVEQGKPLASGEIVSLTPRAEAPQLCDVTVHHKVESPPVEDVSHKGPARVTSRAFRSGWDAIFGGSPETEAPTPPMDPRLLN